MSIVKKEELDIIYDKYAVLGIISKRICNIMLNKSVLCLDYLVDKLFPEIINQEEEQEQEAAKVIQKNYRIHLRQRRTASSSTESTNNTTSSSWSLW
tara:strand:- start:355 stop:645 length:291 start_codon:yes stop_codon:yes gene_type:complete